jgi:ubiquinone biosynthesis protein
MIRQLDPQFDFMGAFREEIKRLTTQHFSLERIKAKTGKFAHELERLMLDAPGDARRALRRIAEGNLGRLQAPAVEALGGRVSRNLKRLTDAIAAAALLIGGSMLVNAPRDTGWHHYFGEALVGAGVFGTLLVAIATMRPDRGRGRGRR